MLDERKPLLSLSLSLTLSYTHTLPLIQYTLAPCAQWLSHVLLFFTFLVGDLSFSPTSKTCGSFDAKSRVLNELEARISMTRIYLTDLSEFMISVTEICSTIKR